MRLTSALVAIAVLSMLGCGGDDDASETVPEFQSSVVGTTGAIEALTLVQKTTFCEDAEEFKSTKTLEVALELEECYPEFAALSQAGVDSGQADLAKAACVDVQYANCTASISEVEKCLGYQIEEGTKIAAQFFGASPSGGEGEEEAEEVPDGCPGEFSVEDLFADTLSNPVALECGQITEKCPEIFASGDESGEAAEGMVEGGDMEGEMGEPTSPDDESEEGSEPWSE